MKPEQNQKSTIESTNITSPNLDNKTAAIVNPTSDVQLKKQTIRSLQFFIFFLLFGLAILTIAILSYFKEPILRNPTQMMLQFIIFLVVISVPFAYKIDFFNDFFVIKTFYFFKRKFLYKDVQTLFIYSPLEGKGATQKALKAPLKNPFCYNPPIQLKFLVNGKEKMINLSLHTSKETTAIVNNIYIHNKNIILDDKCKKAIASDYSYEKSINNAFYKFMFASAGAMLVLEIILLVARSLIK